MKILVTGATGYLGEGIVKRLVDDGFDVIATDFVYKQIRDDISVKVLDVFSLEDPYEYFGQPDVLLHLAWRDGFIHNAPTHFEDLPMHIKFIEKMAKASIKRIAVMGSMHEIGFYEGSIDEETVCRPQSYYGIAKDTLRKATEMICANNGVSFQWLRGYYIVGTSENGSSIFAKIIQTYKQGKKQFPFTTGQNQYDFLDYDEFCLQVATATEQNDIRGIINICSGKPEKLADRVERFISENGLDIKLEYGVFPDRPYDSKAVWGNSKKITEIMNKRK